MVHDRSPATMPRYRYPVPPASEITPPAVYAQRRTLLGMLAAAPLLGLSGCARADEQAPPPATTAPSLPAAAPGAPDPFRTAEEQTRFEDAASYNNFYEFGTGKADPSRHAHSLRTR